MIEGLVFIAFFLSWVGFNFMREGPRSIFYWFGFLSIGFAFYSILLYSTSLSVYWNNTMPYNLTEGMNIGEMQTILSTWIFFIFVLFTLITILFNAWKWVKKE